MVISRRQFLGATFGAGAVGVAGVSYAWGYEPTDWDVTRTAVRMRLGRAISRPIKLLHLSDLHASPSVSLEMLQEAL
jgi:predicted MPP superfamily phosphohydrolase